MIDSSWEVLCNACRTAVASDAETCPTCGAVLLGSAPPQEPPVEAEAHSVSGAVEALTAPAKPLVTRRSIYEAKPMRFGGFWLRLLAWLIDYVVTGIAVVLARMISPAAALLLILVLLFYGPLFESSSWQATVGKRVCGLAVTDLDGRRISFGRALGRSLAKILSLLVFGIGFFMIAFTSRKRGLHDVIAGTLVVHA